MMNKKWRMGVLLFLFLAGVLTGSRIFAGSLTGKKVPEKKPEIKKKLVPAEEMKIIAKVVAYTTQHAHFKKEKINKEISNFLFEDYFKTLDPGRNFFTLQDVERFAAYKDLAASNLAAGELDFAFELFDVFVERLKKYEKFVEQYLASPVPLSGTELYTPNRSKLPYAADEKALEELWRRRIRNDFIVMNMLDRAEKEAAEKAEKEKAEKGSGRKERKKPETKLAPVKMRTPSERIRKRVHQYVQYYSSMEAQEVTELFLTSFLQVYDPHSAYMSPRTQEDFDINMKLSLVGIGAVLTNEDGYTKIVKIIPGGPADKDGRLKAGDRIASVTQENGEHTDLMDMPVSKVVNYIRGKKGTKVTLYVLSQGSSGLQKSITLVRDEVKLKDSEATGKIHKVKDETGKERNIGVITLPSFYIDFEAAFRGDRYFKSSARDVLRLIGEFSAKGLDGLVIDLRGNGGGSLMEAVSLTGLFIPAGPVVQVRDPKNTKVDHDPDGGLIAYAGPLAVLTNRLSASAAEIFAGAIQDYRRGIIVGDRRTHGKGTVQTVADLGKYTSFLGMGKNAGSLKLTNAKFYRINGESTQLRGVMPDIVLPAFTELMELGEDKLAHAMPWDKIAPAAYAPLHTGIPQCLPLLKENSAKRLEKDPDFISLSKDMESYRKIRDKKEVVLDLESRWKEYQAEKKLMEEQEKLLKMDQENDSSKEKKEKDLYLKETLAILNDYISWFGKVRHY